MGFIEGLGSSEFFRKNRQTVLNNVIHYADGKRHVRKPIMGYRMVNLEVSDTMKDTLDKFSQQHFERKRMRTSVIRNLLIEVTSLLGAE